MFGEIQMEYRHITNEPKCNTNIKHTFTEGSEEKRADLGNSGKHCFDSVL